jgi:hypothetical protein
MGHPRLFAGSRRILQLAGVGGRAFLHARAKLGRRTPFDSFAAANSLRAGCALFLFAHPRPVRLAGLRQLAQGRAVWRTAARVRSRCWCGVFCELRSLRREGVAEGTLCGAFPEVDQDDDAGERGVGAPYRGEGVLLDCGYYEENREVGEAEDDHRSDL